VPGIAPKSDDFFDDLFDEPSPTTATDPPKSVANSKPASPSTTKPATDSLGSNESTTPGSNNAPLEFRNENEELDVIPIDNSAVPESQPTMSSDGFMNFDDLEDEFSSANLSDNKNDDASKIKNNTVSDVISETLSGGHQHQLNEGASTSEEDLPSLSEGWDDDLLAIVDSTQAKGEPTESLEKGSELKGKDPFLEDPDATIKIDSVSGDYGVDTTSVKCPVCDSLVYAHRSRAGNEIQCEDCFSMVKIPPVSQWKPDKKNLIHHPVTGELVEKDEQPKPSPSEASTDGGFGLSEPVERPKIDYDTADEFGLEPLVNESDLPPPISETVKPHPIEAQLFGGTPDTDGGATTAPSSTEDASEFSQAGAVVSEPASLSEATLQADFEAQDYELLPLDDLPELPADNSLPEPTSSMGGIPADVNSSNPYPHADAPAASPADPSAASSGNIHAKSDGSPTTAARSESSQSRNTQPANGPDSSSPDGSVNLDASEKAAQQIGGAIHHKADPSQKTAEQKSEPKTSHQGQTDFLDEAKSFMNGIVKVAASHELLAYTGILSLLLCVPYLLFFCAISLLATEEHLWSLIAILIGSIAFITTGVAAVYQGVVLYNTMLTSVYQKPGAAAWPDFSPLEWVGQSLSVGLAALAGALPGLLFGGLVASFAGGGMTLLPMCGLVSMFVLGPPLIMSALYNGQMYLMYAPQVFSTVGKMPMTWVVAYAMIAALCVSVIVVELFALLGICIIPVVQGIFQGIVVSLFAAVVGQLFYSIMRQSGETDRVTPI